MTVKTKKYPIRIRTVKKILQETTIPLERLSGMMPISIPRNEKSRNILLKKLKCCCLVQTTIFSPLLLIFLYLKERIAYCNKNKLVFVKLG